MRVAMVRSTGSVGQTSNHFSRAAGRSKSGGSPLEEPVDGLNGQLFLAELDDQGHHEVVVIHPLAGAVPFLSIPESRLVAMMAVGDQHRFGLDRLTDGRHLL